jgi:hypothetical protein
MRGVGQADAIESVTFRHEEGNEGEKNRVERGNAGLFGVKLLKRQGGSPSAFGFLPEFYDYVPDFGAGCAVVDYGNRRRTRAHGDYASWLCQSVNCRSMIL